MIVDRLVPGMDGLTVIEALRKDQVRTPVLVLSALGAVDDRVRGLRMGGDDYLTKPFALVELIARVEALLRRPVESRETTLRVGPLELDLIERTAKRRDRVIDLLPRAFRLLEYMMQRSDQLLTRAMLLEEVWNYKFVPATNLVDVRSEEHTSELQSRQYLVCRLLLEKKTEVAPTLDHITQRH